MLLKGEADLIVDVPPELAPTAERLARTQSFYASLEPAACM